MAAKFKIKKGDKVVIRECRPLSRTKRWEVIPAEAAS